MAEQVDIKERAIIESGEFQYKQSTKASELIRRIVFAIIASCWVLIFAKDGTYKDTNVFLKIAIACSFVYLLLDVLHYFWDSCSYYKHTQNIVKCESKDYIQKVYIPNREYIAKRSFVIFCLKALAFLLVSAMFLWGMFLAPLSHSTGLDTNNQTVQQSTQQSIIDNSIENDSTERR